MLGKKTATFELNRNNVVNCEGFDRTFEDAAFLAMHSQEVNFEHKGVPFKINACYSTVVDVVEKIAAKVEAIEVDDQTDRAADEYEHNYGACLVSMNW